MALKSFYKALIRRKLIPDECLQETNLNRCLSTLDLTFLGVGSTLGLGIYILAGQVASTTAGPAVIVSFFIAAVASVFAALCYAEFGSRVPRAGSAYVYSYVTVGEFMAFVIGWNLVLEYVIGTASVARGYSSYIDMMFNETIARHLNHSLPIHVPNLSSYPDFLAFGITLLLAIVLSTGVKESSKFNNIFTVVNLLVVVYAVITGSFKASVHNWQLPPDEIPYSKYGTGGFFPYGFHGVMTGAATCFYGYIGFDCIATTGEEVRNPQKAIPVAIVSSLLIVFCAYFSVSTVQTLMWPYFDQDQDAPLPYVFGKVGWPVAKWIITIGALTGLSTSLLGGMFPLPRILYAMANDGLIFEFLKKTHPRFKTPLIATLLSGLFAGFMAMVFNVKELAHMMSIGTLLAYTLVAVSVLILRYRIQEERIPLAPLLLAKGRSSLQRNSIMEGSDTLDSASLDDRGDPFYVRRLAQKNFNASLSTSILVSSTQSYSHGDIWTQLFNQQNIEVQTMLSSRVSMALISTLGVLLTMLGLLLVVLENDLFALDGGAFFAVGSVASLVFLTSIALGRQPLDQQKLSFKVPYVPAIPLLSIFVNIYLMFKLPVSTWYRFAIWMAIGFLIYFGYGIRHSKERPSYIPVLPPISEDPSSESEESAPLLLPKS